MSLDVSIEWVQWHFTLKAVVIITMPTIPIYNYRVTATAINVD